MTKAAEATVRNYAGEIVGVASPALVKQAKNGTGKFTWAVTKDPQARAAPNTLWVPAKNADHVTGAAVTVMVEVAS